GHRRGLRPRPQRGGDLPPPPRPPPPACKYCRPPPRRGASPLRGRATDGEPWIQLRQAPLGQVTPRPELRIRVPPSRHDPAIVRDRAVPLAGRLERLGQHLVQLSVSDVEVRGVEGTTERRLEDRDGL